MGKSANRPSKRLSGVSPAGPSRKRRFASKKRSSSTCCVPVDHDTGGMESPRRFSTGSIGPQASRDCFRFNLWEDKRTPRLCDSVLRSLPSKRSEDCEAVNQGSARDTTHSSTDGKGNFGAERPQDGSSSPPPFDRVDSRSTPRPRQQRRRASWPSIGCSLQRDSTVEAQLIGKQGPKSARGTTVPPSLQLLWEVQGVSGKAYQRDGNLTLYHRKILPRQAYIRLFETMYNTLVPTTEESEAEEAAKWDYSEDTKRLPAALARLGITRETFSDALFAVVDNWTETVRAKDYIDFLQVLWERVRPDFLFLSSPRSSRGGTPSNPFEISGERSSGLPGSQAQKVRRRGVDSVLSTEGTTKARAKVTTVAVEGGKTSAARVGRASTSRTKKRPSPATVSLDGDIVTPPHSPFLAPPPRSPVGLESLHIPGFQHKEAQRAAWVGKGDFILDEFGQVAPFGSVDSAEALEAGEQGRKTRKGFVPDKGAPSERDDDKARVMHAGISAGKHEENGVGESTDESFWNFAARSFPHDAQERDAFLLYVERLRPDLFDSTDEASAGPVLSPHSGRSLPGTLGGNTCPKRYRTDEENSVRTRWRIPTEVLDGLLESWQKAKGCTPAEFGAARLGPLERLSFLAYAIANGWKSMGGGIQSREVWETVLEEWRRGAGRCPEMLVVLDLLEGILRKTAEEALDEAFTQSLDLHSIPHRLLRDDKPEEATRCLQREPRASIAPACQSSSMESIVGIARRPATEGGVEPISGTLGKADLHVLEHEGESEIGNRRGSIGVKEAPVPRRLGAEDEGSETDSSARDLLHGQRVAGVVRQGQVVFYTCACPTERGTCLEITLQSEGVKDCRSGSSNGEVSAISGTAGVHAILSLYATQAPFRPARLSSYSWISRGKTFHRLLLNWKGQQKPSAPEERASGGNASSVPSSLPPPATPILPPAPIHIAVVCPESIPLPPPPASANEERGTERAGVRCGASNGVVTSERRTLRVTYTVGVRVMGSSRVILEGRWHSLPWGEQTCTGAQAMYATLRLPTPLRVTEWGPPFEEVDACAEGRAPRGTEGDEKTRSSGPGVAEEGAENAQRRSLFVDAEILVTLQIRPSDPRKRVDVYCGSSPRPGPNPTEQTWWMSAGGFAHCPNKEVPSESPLRRKPSAGVMIDNPIASAQTTVTPPSKSSKPAPRPRMEQSSGNANNKTHSSLHSSRAVTPKIAGDLTAFGGRDSPAQSFPAGSCLSTTATSENGAHYGSSTDNTEMEAIICSGTTEHGAKSSDAFTDIDQNDSGTRPRRENEQRYDSSEQSRSLMAPWTTSSELVLGGDGGWTPLPARGTPGTEGASWSRMTVAMPRDHAGAFHVGIFGAAPYEAEGVPDRGTIDMKAVAWCPAVTVPSRVPLCGHLPRGQRRELLWSIEREAPFFEGRVEVTRAIEDPLVLQQLEFVQNIQSRFGSSGDDVKEQRIPVADSGPECQSTHMRPFVVASRRVSPSQNEYTWRGVNMEGTLEILQKPKDGTNRVFTRYTETLKRSGGPDPLASQISPRDSGFGIGRCRLALEAGATDCSFRFLFWNRSPTPQDCTLPSTPLTTISVPNSSTTFPSHAHHSAHRDDGGGQGLHAEWIPRELSSSTPPNTRHSASRHPETSIEAYMPATTPTALASEICMVDEPVDSGAASERCETISDAKSPKPGNGGKDRSLRWGRRLCDSGHTASPFLITKILGKDDELRSATAVVNMGNDPVASGRGSKLNGTRCKFPGSRRPLTLAKLYLNSSLCDSSVSPEWIPARPQRENNSPTNRRGFSLGHGFSHPKTTRWDGSDPALAHYRNSWGPVFAAENCESITMPLTSRSLVSSVNPPACVFRVRRVVAPMQPLPRTQVVVASTTRAARPAAVVASRGVVSATGKETDTCAHGVLGVDCPGEVGYTVSLPTVRRTRDYEIDNNGSSIQSDVQRRTSSRVEADLSPPRIRGYPRSEASTASRVPRLRLERLAAPVQEAPLSWCSIAINPSLNRYSNGVRRDDDCDDRSRPRHAAPGGQMQQRQASPKKLSPQEYIDDNKRK